MDGPRYDSRMNARFMRRALLVLILLEFGCSQTSNPERSGSWCRWLALNSWHVGDQDHARIWPRLIAFDHDRDQAVILCGAAVECWSIETRKRLWEFGPSSKVGPGVLPKYWRIGDRAIIQWAGTTHGLDAQTGQVRWNFVSDVAAAHERGIILGETPKNQFHVVPRSVHDPVTGRLLWKFPDLPAGSFRATPTWCRTGLFVIERASTGSRLTVHRPDSGEPVWTRRVEKWKSDVERGGVGSDRALVLHYSPECTARPDDEPDDHFERWHERVGSATCIRYELIDLSSGEALWEESTGGRDHSLGHHGEADPADFSPDHGGPAAWLGDHVAWYDRDRQTLQLISTSNAKTVFEGKIPDGLSMDNRDLPFRGLRFVARKGPWGREGALDIDRMAWTWVPGLCEWDFVYWISPERFLVDLNARDNGSPQWFGLARIENGKPKRLWKADYSRSQMSSGDVANPPLVDAKRGDLVLWEEQQGRFDVRVLSLEDGKNIASMNSENHHSWIQREGRYLFLPTGQGFDVYRGN